MPCAKPGYFWIKNQGAAPCKLQIFEKTDDPLFPIAVRKGGVIEEMDIVLIVSVSLFHGAFHGKTEKPACANIQQGHQALTRPELRIFSVVSL